MREWSDRRTSMYMCGSCADPAMEYLYQSTPVSGEDHTHSMLTSGPQGAVVESSAMPVRGSPTSSCTTAGALAVAASNGGPASSSSLSTAALLLSVAAQAGSGWHDSHGHPAVALLLPPSAVRHPLLPCRQRPMAKSSSDRMLCMAWDCMNMAHKCCGAAALSSAEHHKSRHDRAH